MSAPATHRDGHRGVTLEPPFAWPALVAGEPRTGASTTPVHHPYDGAEIGRVPVLDAADVREALDATRATGALSRHERAQVLNRVADRLEREGEPVARLITWESGLALSDTRHEVRRAADVFRFAAMEALRDDGAVFACDTSGNGRSRRAYTLREPVGLSVAITPFNHPLNQVAHKLAPAVAAGTPVVLKPSEKTPLAALWLGRALVDAGLPPAMLSVVTGAREQILDAMLAHDRVEVVSFTGGVAVGRTISDRLGYRRAVLELGGNDPLLVLRDADLDLAARLAVSGATHNSGQRCTAVKRVIVEEPVADELVERVLALAGALVVGDPFDERTDVGTLIDEEAAERVERRVADAVAAGARLRFGGERRGALLVPPVLDGVRPSMELVREETFGPAIPLLRVSDLDEALETANGTRFGLSSGVVSNDLGAIMRCVRELRCGSVNVNEAPGYRTELTPFGGIRDSGLGVKEGVVEAVRGLTTQKLYTLPW